MAGIKGRSGGKRMNSRIKSKLTDPDVLADWNMQLKRAICSASSNVNVLRRDSFFATKEITAAFGKKALAEFKSWFEASKHFDQATGDKLYQELARGKLDEAKFKRLLYTTAYFWVWTIKPEMQRRAWAVSRGLEGHEPA